jgi:hypothetical protein
MSKRIDTVAAGQDSIAAALALANEPSVVESQAPHAAR